jgi:ABC-type dipeptide/oligopeptide/nickel transport system ATPase component
VSAPVLVVDDLAVHAGGVPLVEGVGFTLAPGGTLGIVGESGSGKTMTALALLRLLPAGARVVRGRALFGGEDLLQASETRMREVRGRGIAMVFQEPMSALNPVLTIGTQLERVIARHRAAGSRAARDVAADALARVGIADPARRLRQHPHELSGGMRQRVALAMALACEPSVLIADEPTTALDATTQAQALGLIADLQRELRMALILITHDLAVVAQTCERVVVMRAGVVVEEGSTADVIGRPAHDYTRGLVESTRRFAVPRAEAGA